METPTNPVRTEAQRKALADYDMAARALAEASMALKKAQDEYTLAANEYLRAHGAAKQAGVV